jgi:hypothetical protein
MLGSTLYTMDDQPEDDSAPLEEAEDIPIQATFAIDGVSLLCFLSNEQNQFGILVI